jgi:26S proteasome regulatory subunit N1
VTNPDPGVRAGAVLGLGLAYAGTRREEVAELLVPLVLDTEVSMEVGGRGGFLGSGKGLVRLVQLPMWVAREASLAANALARPRITPRQISGFAALALGLVFASSCKEDVVEAILTALMSR